MRNETTATAQHKACGLAQSTYGILVSWRCASRDRHPRRGALLTKSARARDENTLRGLRNLVRD
eukprot:3115445-Pleurochrysis_carterae.AAC.1